MPSVQILEKCLEVAAYRQSVEEMHLELIHLEALDSETTMFAKGT
jgi:hypothetical protein